MISFNDLRAVVLLVSVGLASSATAANVDPVVEPEGDQRAVPDAAGESIPGSTVRPEGMDQSKVPKTPMDRKGSVAQDVGVKTPATRKGPLAEPDQVFLKKMHQVEMGEIAAAELAMTQTTTPEVLAFARTMKTDHGAGHADINVLAERNNIPLDKRMDAEHAALVAALKQTRGAAFDHQYMGAQISGHRKAIVACENASTASGDAEIKALADRKLPTLRKHLADAQRIGTSLGSPS